MIGIRKHIVAFALAAAASASVAVPAMACRTTGAQGIAGQTVTASMSVEQGKSCFIRQFTTKSDAVGNRRFPTTNIRILAKPSSGSVAVAGNRVTYTSRAGARGADAFTYRAQLDNGKTFDYRVNVQVY